MKSIKSILAAVIVVFLGASAWAGLSANPTSVSVAVGESKTVTITATSSTSGSLSVGTSNYFDATLSATSISKGGSVTLTIKGKSTTSRAQTLKVSCGKSSVSISVTVTAAKTVESKTSTVELTSSDGATDLQLVYASRFSQSVAWNSTVTSGDGNVATATMKNGTTSTRQPTMTITPKGAGTTTLTVKNSSNTASYDYTWTVTVTVKQAIDTWTFKGRTVETIGAEKLSQTDDELVLAWKTGTGTLKVPDLAVADILVVGAGGGAGGGYTSSQGSAYGGDAGSAGEVKELLAQDLGALNTTTEFAITVGAGGAGGTGKSGTTETNDGKAGGESSLIGGEANYTARGGAGGASRKRDAGDLGTKSTSNPGTGTAVRSAITGQMYGQGGAAAVSGGSATPADAAANTGNGGDAPTNPGTNSTASTGADGGSGIVIVRLTSLGEVREVIAVPTAATGLKYAYVMQTGVAAGDCYELSGIYEASMPGDYVAVATPKDGYCWPDKSHGPTNIAWSIDYRDATVTVIDTNKVSGAEEPVYRTRNEGFIAEDPAELTWVAWRTNTSETVGTYDILVGGDEIQGGYRIAYVGGTLTIEEAPPVTFDITIAKLDCVTDVRTNGVSVVGTLTLPVDATEVALELVSTNTIPVFKFSRNGGDWVVTNRTPVIAVAADDTLAFMSAEAKADDPTVTPDQAREAIVASIDLPKGPEDVERYEKAVAKVREVTAGDEPAVEPKALATWITDNGIKSAGLAQSDYVVASVNLNTSEPITAENTEIKFTEVEAATSDGFVFDFELRIGGTEEELTLAKEYAASVIQTTGDLGEDFKAVGDPDRVTIDPETGKVTIKPDSVQSAEFFKIVIPKDPGAK